MNRSTTKPGRRHILASLLAMWLPSVVVRVPPARAAGTLEYAVKAAFLLKFPAFITWPEPLPPSNFNLCVVGQNPFGDLLRQAAAGQIVDQRMVTVRTVEVASRTSGCQVMYVAGSESQPVGAALLTVRGLPVLTVTDGQSDPDTKGIINFVLIDGRVRFEVNLRAAEENHVTVSSKLLSVAFHVYGNA